jgi:hypothetical protein
MTEPAENQAFQLPRRNYFAQNDSIFFENSTQLAKAKQTTRSRA